MNHHQRPQQPIPEHETGVRPFQTQRPHQRLAAPAPNTHLPGTVTPGGAFPTKLDVKAMTITVALMWSAAMLLTGIASLVWNGYAQAFLDVVASVYPGYNATSTLGDVIVGALYALLDGAVGGLVLAWLYNRLATH